MCWYRWEQVWWDILGSWEIDSVNASSIASHFEGIILTMTFSPPHTISASFFSRFTFFLL